MKLYEFLVCWKGNYSKEQQESYRVLYGEDKDSWPETDDEEPIVIDIDRICRFNTHFEPDKTTVELAGGYSYSLVIQYEKFKAIMNEHSSITGLTRKYAL